MRIALVGIGATGLLALAKTFSMAKRHPQVSVTVHAFDVQAAGQGVHRIDQADYLRLNTVAGQLSMFEDDDFSLFPRHSFRPTLYDWLAREHPGAISGAQDRFAYLPRKYLGLYLQWFFTQLLEHTPGNVRFESSCSLIHAVEDEPDGRFRLLASPPVSGAYDTLLLCTGHGVLSGNTSAMPGIKPYPLPGALEAIACDSTVAIQGVGLTAMDVVAALTTGRGGTFERTTGGLKYLPCGHEPVINLYSNSGMPYRARPEVDDAVIRHQPLLLTRAAIDQIRRGTPDQKIDFEKQLLPLLHQEMAAAYYCACASQYENSVDGYQSQYRKARARLQQALAAGNLPGLFTRLAEEYGAYLPHQVLPCNPPDDLTDSSYPLWFVAQLQTDIQESTEGCRHNPLKKSLEIWRDLRNELCYAIDHQGLNRDAHHVFYTHYCPLINRLVAGPQKERHAELVALIQSGHVNILPGYDATDSFNPVTRQYTLTLKKPVEQRFIFDHLIKANISARHAQHELHALLSSIIEDPGALSRQAYSDFSTYNQPDFVHSYLRKRIYVFGPTLEGSSYYNHYVPSGSRSRISSTLEKCLNNAIHYYSHCFSNTF